MEKKIYKSYFARKASDPNSIAICCSLSNWVKEAGFSGKHRRDLAPTWDLVNAIKAGNISRQSFSQRYIKTLNDRGLTPQGILDSLPHSAILLCYETPNEFCHRHVLADWIELSTGFKIMEVETEKEQNDREQQKVVDDILVW